MNIPAPHMKPIIILPPDAMSEVNINLLRENGLCVVVANKPENVRFLDPIPAIGQRTQIEAAAIHLSRRVLNDNYNCRSRSDFATLFMDILIKGTSLDVNPPPTKAQREEEYFTTEKLNELSRLAREEAKTERAAKRAAPEKKGAEK